MAAHDPSGAEWRKSSYSGDNACVEIAVAPGRVLMRDSTDPDGPTLAVPGAAWRAFLNALTP